MFKKITAAVAAMFLCAGLAQAADSCDKQAEDKKLAGAAKTSFLKKCNADSAAASPAAAACDKAAAEKKGSRPAVRTEETLGDAPSPMSFSSTDITGILSRIPSRSSSSVLSTAGSVSVRPVCAAAHAQVPDRNNAISSLLC
jgi:hypothetical protein